ncbi:cytochrome P450 [Mycena galopus ATCC 62051]|nr:cytochrome P450 [Mycena galopus ATCC 62051]
MTSLEHLPVAVLPLILFALAALLKGWQGRYRTPFPPGPKPRFILGNFYDMPTEFPWLTYAKWGKQYGDVVHVDVFGNHILILNSVKVATQLLEKRARIYSDRPTIPMVSLMGWDWNLSFMPHAEKWRQKKIRDLLCSLLSTPEDFVMHTRTLAAAIIMATVYGYNIKSMHDRIVWLAEESSCVTSLPGFQGVVSMVLPELVDEMKNAPFDLVRQNMRDGVGRPSVLSSLLEENEVG